MPPSGGANTTTQKFEPPGYTVNAWKDYLGGTIQAASQPYQQYQGMTVAPLNDVQNAGLQMAVDRAANGAPDLNSARQMTTNTTNGNYLGISPAANNSVSPGTNQYMGQNVSAQTNPYAGPNPYLEGVVGGTVNDMTNAYRMGTAAQTDSMAARQGAFGGSAWEQMQGANAQGLAKQIAQATGQLRMQDYTGQQGLAENAINRNLDAQKFNQTSNSGLAENALNRSVDAQKFNLTTDQGAWDAERNRMLSAGQLAGTLSQDDWTAAKTMTGAGDAYNAYTQSLLDASKQEFQNQQMYPFQMLQQLGDALSRSSGTYGGGGSSVQTNAGAGQSALGLLGLAPAAYGIAGLAGKLP